MRFLALAVAAAFSQSYGVDGTIQQAAASAPKDVTTTEQEEEAALVCTPLTNTRKKRILTKRPDSVTAMLERQNLTVVYQQLVEAVFKSPRSRWGGWKMSKVYQAAYAGGFEATFNAAGVGLFLRKENLKGRGGSKKAICLLDRSLVQDEVTRIRSQYTDAITGLDKDLVTGVVSVPLLPVRSDTRTRKLEFDGGESTDLKKFLEDKNMVELQARIKAAIAASNQGAKWSSTPQGVAAHLVVELQKFTQELQQRNVVAIACYAKEKVWSWRQLFRGYHFKLWIEYKDLDRRYTYTSPHAIVPPRKCEPMNVIPGRLEKTADRLRKDEPLELYALKQVHGIAALFTQISKEIVATKADAEVTTWDPLLINQVLYKHELPLQAQGVELYMTLKEGTGNENTPAKNVNLCWKDLSQSYLFYHLESENVYHDSSRIQNGMETFKDLPTSVLGESFVNVSGKLLLPEATPADLQRVLEKHEAVSIHDSLVGALMEIPPNREGIQAHIFDVNSIAERFAEAFYAKGIKIFVCSRTQKVSVGGRIGHIFFSWMEFAEHETMFYNYMPEDKVKNPVM